MDTHKIYAMPFAKVYLLYTAKAARKGRTRAEGDHIIHWLTGYVAPALTQTLNIGTDFAGFFANGTALNPACALVTGIVCGIRRGNRTALMRDNRILNEMTDDMAMGRAIKKILRQPPASLI